MPASKQSKVDSWLLPPPPSSSSSPSKIKHKATTKLVLPPASPPIYIHKPVDNPPSFPVEILGLIVAACPKASLRSLLATNRTFRDLARPRLFTAISIRGAGELPRLISISKDPHVAPLVRLLNVAFPLLSDPHVSSWYKVMTTIARTLPLLTRLVRFTLHDSPSDRVYLTAQLLQSILTHPSLSVLRYPKLWHTRNHFKADLEEDQKVGFVIEQLDCPHPDDHETDMVLPFGSLLNRIEPFAYRYNISIRSLFLVPVVGDGTDPFLLLLKADLPGLEEVELEFVAPDAPFPSSFGEWFKDLFEAFPKLLAVLFTARIDGYGNGEKIYLPCESLMQVAGLKERVASKDTEKWWKETPLQFLGLRFQETKDSEGGREVVVLTLVQHPSLDGPSSIHGGVLRGLAAQFPSLRHLSVRSAVGSSLYPKDPQYLTELASFPLLENITLPVEYLSEPMTFCHDDYEFWAETLEAEAENGPEDPEDPLDPDGRLLERLYSTGRLARRDTPKAFVNRCKRYLIAVATSLGSLRQIQLDVSVEYEEVGSVEWTVRRRGGKVSLEETSSSEELLESKCTCESFCRDDEDLIEALKRLPPLFERSSADFEPAFTLDRFVVPRR